MDPEALPVGREWLGDPDKGRVWSCCLTSGPGLVGGRPGWPGMIGRPPQWAGSVQDSLLEGHEWSADTPGGLAVVRSPSRRARSGQEALPVGREALSMCRIVQEALPDGRQLLGDSPGGPGVIGRPSRRAASDRKALLQNREWLGGPPGGTGVVGRPSRRAGSCREALLEGCD